MPRPARAALTVRKAIDALHAHYGSPEPLPTTDAFELVLWENVAYLTTPARRREAFDLLRETIGTRPDAILAAGKRALERVTARGILKGTFAEKLRRCARIAIEQFDGDLAAVVAGPLDAAKKALRSFPGIAEPGADKILLFAGRHAQLAPESNGLRVLVRLGLVPERKSYAQTYAASRDAANDLAAKPNVMQRAHLLLQQHGRTLCKRNAPRCAECPLVRDCLYCR